MATEILSPLHALATEIENEAINLKTALDLVQDVLRAMHCADKDDTIAAQGKLFYLMDGIEERQKNIKAISVAAYQLHNAARAAA